MKTDKIINLRDEESKPDFRISSGGSAETSPVTEEEIASMNPQKKVKLSFGRFVNLAMNRNYEDIVEKHFEEEVILSADVLADLANAEAYAEDEGKSSKMLIMGVVLGVALAWFFLKY